MTPEKIDIDVRYGKAAFLIQRYLHHARITRPDLNRLVAPFTCLGNGVVHQQFAVSPTLKSLIGNST